MALRKDISTKRGIQTGALLFVVLVVAAMYTFRNVGSEIPLQYSRPWGTGQLVPRASLLVLAVIGTILAIAHSAVATLLFENDRLSSRIVIWSGVLLLFLLLVSVITAYIRVGPQT